MKALVWFRRDLRLRDNAAIAAALASGLPVEAIYEHEREGEHASAGAASRWYLHHSLIELQRDLALLGIPLHLITGSPESRLPAFCTGNRISQIFWNRVVEPQPEAGDDRLQKLLSRDGVASTVSMDDCLLMPEQGCKEDGSAYRVFTPFWRNLQSRLHMEDLQSRLYSLPRAYAKPVACSPAAVEALQLLPRHSWHLKLHRYWQPGEAAQGHVMGPGVDSRDSPTCQEGCSEGRENRYESTRLGPKSAGEDSPCHWHDQEQDQEGRQHGTVPRAAVRTAASMISATTFAPSRTSAEGAAPTSRPPGWMPRMNTSAPVSARM